MLVNKISLGLGLLISFSLLTACGSNITSLNSINSDELQMVSDTENIFSISAAPNKMPPPPPPPAKPPLNMKEIEKLFPTVAAAIKKFEDEQKAILDAALAKIKASDAKFAKYLADHQPPPPPPKVEESEEYEEGEEHEEMAPPPPPPPPLNMKEIEKLFPAIFKQLKVLTDAHDKGLQALIDAQKKANAEFAKYLAKNAPAGKMPPPPPPKKK